MKTLTGLMALTLTLMCVAGVASAQDVMAPTPTGMTVEDLGRIVDHRFVPMGDRRVASQDSEFVALSGPRRRPGVVAVEQTSNTERWAAARAWEETTAERIRYSQASGYVRATQLTFSRRLRRTPARPAALPETARYYVHAIHFGRLYELRVSGGRELVTTAVRALANGQSTGHTNVDAIYRGYAQPAEGHPAFAGGSRVAPLAESGPEVAILVTYRALPSSELDPARVAARNDAELAMITALGPGADDGERFHDVLSSGTAEESSRDETDRSPVGERAQGMPVTRTGPPAERTERRARVVIRRPQILEGAANRDVLHRHLRRRAAAMRRCYERALSANPNIAGNLRLIITVDPRGRVTRVVVDENGVGDQVLGCMRNLVRRLRFSGDPPMTGRARVTILFTR